MRAFITTSVKDARQILATGFIDCYSFGTARGVWVGKQPLTANDGFQGDVVLAVDIPTEVFDANEMIESLPDRGGEFQTGKSIVPAAVLNRHGPARIYDHDYFTTSRRDLVKMIHRWEQHADSIDAVLYPDKREQTLVQVARLRGAIEFFDEIGWLTPLKAKELG